MIQKFLFYSLVMRIEYFYFLVMQEELAILKAVNHPANSGGLQKLKLNYNF